MNGAAPLLVAGALLAGAGLALAGFFGWQMAAADPATTAAQAEAAEALVMAPSDRSPGHEGDPVTRLHIPAIAADWVVLEGTTQNVLAGGPGHYAGTAQPGEEGNVGIAGHRVTHGAPFYRLDELQPCDDIILAAHDVTYRYRVLPAVGELSTCGLPALSVPGREVVTPDAGNVLEPVPGQHLVTLTTCHPRFSATQRLVIHAVLVP